MTIIDCKFPSDLLDAYAERHDYDDWEIIYSPTPKRDDVERQMTVYFYTLKERNNAKDNF